MRRLFLFGLVVSMMLVLTSAALCQESDEGYSEEPPPMYSTPEYADPVFSEKMYNPGDFQMTSKVHNRDNGIVVGQPKLFELRSLQMMIDNVKASLAQTTMPDPSKLFEMTGGIQGAESSTSSTSAEAVVVPGSGPDTTKSVSVPHGSTSSADSGSNISLSPTDVLAEQTSLWHQLVNLQMLLDGALSDRLIPVDEYGCATVPEDAVRYSPRAQAIIGFQISVDPRKDLRNAVAEAIITIDNKSTSVFGLGGYGDEPSLMMLLPKSQTYNTISISRDSKSFGLGSVVNIVSFGASRDTRKETYYIGKDTDTVALERIPGLPAYGLDDNLPKDQSARYRGVSFGWQFRPVFKRSAVDPGIRQVFAMISLPASVTQEKWVGKVHVTTYWRKFDRATGTVGEPIRGTVNEWVLDDITVPIGSGFEKALEPCITKVDWDDAGGGNVAVNIEGSNFSLGTDITCGDKMLGEEDLSLMSAKRIRFIASAADIARGDVTLIGRYGIANLRQSTGCSDNPYEGVIAAPPVFTQQDDKTIAVELTLLNVQQPQRLISGRRPVVKMGGMLFGVGENPFTSVTADGERQALNISFSVPSEVLAKTGRIVVCDLIGPAAVPVEYGGCVAHKAVVLSAGYNVSVAVFGSGFSENVRVQVGGSEVSNLSLNSYDGDATMITFEVDSEVAGNARYILITQGDQSPVLVPFSMTDSSGE